jgi:hypothetical protein
MRTIFGIVAIATALVSWQPSGHAVVIGAMSEEAQPLTRADCDKAGLAWDDDGNICDWQPQEQLASEPTITGTITSVQPLTRVDCGRAGLAWDDNGNVCDWQPESSKQQLASEPMPDITGAITSGQPLTRADCDKAGLAWNDSGNVCESLNRRT